MITAQQAKVLIGTVLLRASFANIAMAIHGTPANWIIPGSIKQLRKLVFRWLD